MDIRIEENASELGKNAGSLAGEILRAALKSQSRARLIVATGASQFETLATLTSEPGIDWNRVDGFHLDEYIGLSADHPASFCGYLRDRFVKKVPIGSFHYLNGLGEPAQVIAGASQAWRAAPIDLALIGIGENGHLAFNDPPADFETTEEYHIVNLDEACRLQQVGEGWFASLADVPTRAFSMTVSAILASKAIICSVPDERKAVAVRNALEGPLTPDVPASILRQHPALTLVLDKASASRLSK
ncbi:glucosamine-6-phosphate deaminase [Pirellulaceae bacterium SH467]